MSLGANLSFKQMAELAAVSVEQLEVWVADGSIPITPGTDRPNPAGKTIPRIPLQQVIVVRGLRDGKSIEEARAEMFAVGPQEPWKHRPPIKTPEEKTRERIEADRQAMFQKLRRGA